MRLQCTVVPDWPPLAWLAICDRGSSEIVVFHGSRVEVADDWFSEAAWTGGYDSGDFDHTDIVAGSGGRVRSGVVVFVSSGSTVDRLHSLQVRDGFWVSNSLSCLLAASDAYLSLRHTTYREDIKSIRHGLAAYKRTLATSAGSVQFTYFDNLVWNGQVLTVQPKPGANRDFSSFARYRYFLAMSFDLLSQNLAAKHRQYPYRMLSTLSRGYDSTMVTALGKEVGCVEALSFDRSDDRHEDPEHDNGEPVARALGVRSIVVPRDTWRSLVLPEVPFIAGSSSGGDVVFKGAEQHLAGRVLFTGYHGDKIWSTNVKHVSDDIVRGDTSGLSLTEYRLWTGFIHSPVPFWGARQCRDVHVISGSLEMTSWDVGVPSYRRPICRRIVEEAGVPRELFGVRKRAVTVPLHTSGQLMTPSSREEYLAWLESRRTRGDDAARFIAQSCAWLLRHTDWPIRGWSRVRRPLARIANKLDRDPHRFTFPWAIEQSKRRYPKPF